MIIMFVTAIVNIATLTMINLYPHQLEAIENMKNGCILCGSVGSGKSRAALAYYYLKVCEGTLNVNGKGKWGYMEEPRHLYIITTAKKRDSMEWDEELLPFGLTRENKETQQVEVYIDSWNNIKKYKDIHSAFFIFDEQRVVGYGTWTKAFLNIARKNQWILLSATPGDTWSDYIPVFIANGYFKNKTEFVRNHIVYCPHTTFPQIDRYVNQGPLIKYRNDILIDMKFDRHTTRRKIVCKVDYNKALYRRVWVDRWNVFEDEPIPEQGKLGYLLRRVTNEDPSRILKLIELLESIPKVIIFYNFTYELEILRDTCEKMCIPYSEWNGEKHEPICKGKNWAYLVQYSAGAEGWNCIETDSMIFYSQNYSYKMTEQAMGRIDRMNTPYEDLFYYILKSNSPIDLAIGRALANKRNFNESRFLKNS